MRHASGGFTLVELTVVVAVIVALAAVVVPMVGSARREGQVESLLQVVDTLRGSCQRYWADMGTTATEFSDSTATTDHQLSLAQSSPDWKGPYISQPLTEGDNEFGGKVRVFNSLNSALGGGFRLVSASGPRLRGTGNFVRFTNIPQDVAQLCDDALDDNVPGAWRNGGRVRWSANGGGRMDVFLFDVDGQ